MARTTTNHDDADATTHAAVQPADAPTDAAEVWEQQQQRQQQPPSAAAAAPAATNAGFDPTAWPPPQLLPRADEEDREAWALARRRGGLFKNRCGAGNAAGSQEALREMRHLSMVCRRPGCGALVDYKVARRHAKQAGRSGFEPGDGCAGPAPCSSDHRPARFRKRQREHAAELESGERQLVQWPRDIDDRGVWAYSPEAAAAAAAAARAAAQ